MAKKNKNDKILRPVHPNCGIEAEYRRRLRRLLDEMHRSVSYWVESAYRGQEDQITQDASPAAELRASVQRLARRWLKKFDELAPKLADHFSRSVGERSDKALSSILRTGGMSVKFKQTPRMRGVVQATTAANVGLIKSIPQQYLGAVEGIVMRGIQAGRDLEVVSKELQKQFGVTKRRAALISRDQNNKATASMTRVRQQELGIKKAIWVHSGGGKKPRPTHVKNNGKTYDVNRGWYDPAESAYIYPGELINCRCVARAVIEGFE